MNILAVGPHPDDIEFGCGGAVIKYAEKGHDVFLLVVSRGEMGGKGDVRYQEQLKAAEIMGFSHEEMKDILQESGAEIHMGPRTVDELLRDASHA